MRVLTLSCTCLYVWLFGCCFRKLRHSNAGAESPLRMYDSKKNDTASVSSCVNSFLTCLGESRSSPRLLLLSSSLFLLLFFLLALQCYSLLLFFLLFFVLFFLLSLLSLPLSSLKSLPLDFGLPSTMDFRRASIVLNACAECVSPTIA